MLHVEMTLYTKLDYISGGLYYSNCNGNAVVGYTKGTPISYLLYFLNNIINLILIQYIVNTIVRCSPFKTVILQDCPNSYYAAIKGSWPDLGPDLIHFVFYSIWTGGIIRTV